MVELDWPSYLRPNRVRKPRFVSPRKKRRAARSALSGGGALAAARARSRCVLFEGCPVVRVHFSFGLALHAGHGTDNIRLCVSCPVCTSHSVHHLGFRKWSILLFLPPINARPLKGAFVEALNHAEQH